MDTAMFREMWDTLLKREYGYKLKNQKIILIQKVAQLLFKVSIKVVLDFFNRPTEYLSVSVGYNAVCYLGGDLVEGEDGEDAAVADAGCALDCVCVQALHRLVQPGAVVEVES